MMSRKKSILDCSLLDMHKYSKTAFQYLYDKLTDDKFKRAYVDKNHPINAVTGVLWDITQGNEEIVKIISEMDKIDNIRAESSISKLEKITATWIKKAYRKHFSEGTQISQTIYLRFINTIMNHNNEEGTMNLRFAAKNLFDKIYGTYRARQHSIGKSNKFNELIERYPKLNIDKAYRYAIMTGKFNLNSDDIEEFEYILKFALSSKENSNKRKYIIKKC